ncbi:DUF6518 family protein [Cellulomonas wangsupingiae]|uniref:DUF6518 family protein n=1 Tax=Cellulomonas wangsupingiae TaxID=2968085 RepID=A0ABY5K4Z1_9CELL|nr:DUF6518 family protein [Cellulomonas wangsupingiae]MCC2335747.1 DUF6518 family protein [Cellulomonas wangsupingiae]MCM0641124.1 DUF6518 family protein [Cellulomonas wangsupingiae]UUI63981.1 DUF6518 family protein [Cellulomonas wangsupingiae]
MPPTSTALASGPPPPVAPRPSTDLGPATPVAPGPTTGGSGASGPQAVAVAVLAGLVVGALTSFAQGLPLGPFGGLANAVAPWLLVPFGIGALARGWRWALGAGVVACVAQVAGYYVAADLRDIGVGAPWLLIWLACALPGGAVAAVAGRSWWRTGPLQAGLERGAGAAVLVAAWLAEAVVRYAVVLRYPGHAVVFAVTGLVALALLGWRGRQHARVALWLVPALVPACGVFAALPVR